MDTIDTANRFNQYDGILQVSSTELQNDKVHFADSMHPIKQLCYGTSTKGAIKSIIRNQKTFLDVFNKYQGEVRSLQMTVECRFKKLNSLEKRLMELAESIQCDTEQYLKHKQNNKAKQMSQSYQQYSEVINSLMEPIIDLQVNDMDGSPSVNTSNQSTNSIEDIERCSEALLNQVDVDVSDEVNSTVKRANMVNTNRISRKMHTHVSSKTEFMKLIDCYKQTNNLVRERVSKNVMTIQTKDTDSIIGYQCSVTGCNYMHFLRAQVNRHYKNYHSKTCNHCNQRFKRPIDLLIHLNENKLTIADATHCEEQNSE